LSTGLSVAAMTAAMFGLAAVVGLLAGKKETARVLGVSLTTLYNKLRKFQKL